MSVSGSGASPIDLTSVSTPDKVESRLGTLEFDDGAPSAETAASVYDNLDFQNGVIVLPQHASTRSIVDITLLPSLVGLETMIELAGPGIKVQARLAADGPDGRCRPIGRSSPRGLLATRIRRGLVIE